MSNVSITTLEKNANMKFFPSEQWQYQAMQKCRELGSVIPCDLYILKRELNPCEPIQFCRCWGLIWLVHVPVLHGGNSTETCGIIKHWQKKVETQILPLYLPCQETAGISQTLHPLSNSNSTSKVFHDWLCPLPYPWVRRGPPPGVRGQ